MFSMGLRASLGLAIALAAIGRTGAAPAPGFVTRHGEKLWLNGAEYRAIGANIPPLSQAYSGVWFHTQQIYGSPEKARDAMIDALDDAQRSHIAFIRFFANPGYPRDTDMLYMKDRAKYWSLMDDLFAQCRRRHIKLVPSLNTLHGWYSYCAEPAQAILDPASKTYQATRTYIQEFVTRYRDDTTVLMWELENEPMLAADVDMAGNKLLPAAVYSPGAVVRETGTREDSLTWDMILRLYRDQTAYIKSLDPNHLVTSGDACVRPECTSRRETFPNFKYRNDTLREWLGNNLLSQPEPLDVISFHNYGNFGNTEPASLWGLSHLDYLRAEVRVVHAARQPVFIGELGQMNPTFKADPTAKWTCAAIDLLEHEGASLAAIWVWHFPWQPDLTVSSASHPALIRRIAAFNKRYAHAVE